MTHSPTVEDPHDARAAHALTVTKVSVARRPRVLTARRVVTGQATDWVAPPWRGGGDEPIRLAPARARRVVRIGGRFTQLMVGLILQGTSAAATMRAGHGVLPWDVWHLGLAYIARIQVGTAVIITSVIVCACWVPLRLRPGLGTLASLVVPGAVINVMRPRFHPVGPAWESGLLAAAGVVGFALAIALYLGAGFGPSAGDGLMTGLSARGHSLRAVRIGLDLTLLFGGCAMLGAGPARALGAIGPVTLFGALATGPLVHIFLPYFRHQSADWNMPRGW